ncbi:hypothetical protein B9Z19DRAFT_1026156 [Tuber borchii]|uniref:Ribosomal RNA-processing protein 40 n=1 Tax=Tuber borchii TaxID=42251 RepID=A0A2T6ZR24_TUBBO|nr:hypothetical protein B9Z19DRAFT_1026156 [Tuber borchii]
MSLAVHFPGETLPPLEEDEKKNTTFKVGPGLTHILPSTLIVNRAGELNIDQRKHTIWMESNGKRYVASQNDTIIATVLRSTSDSYICAIPSSNSPVSSTSQAVLPHLAFPQATKKTRPMLHQGSVVFARISLANKHIDPELECYDADSGKAEGFGELKGGFVFGVSLGMARRLLGDAKKTRLLRVKQRRAEAERRGEEYQDAGADMSSGKEVLEELGQNLSFELAVGRNGRVWVHSGDPKTTLCVMRCIQQSEFLTGKEQRQLAKEALKALGQ